MKRTLRARRRPASQPVFRRNAVWWGAPFYSLNEIARCERFTSGGCPRLTTHPPEPLRSDTRDASRPAPISRARSGPRPVEVAIPTSIPERPHAEGPAPPDPMTVRASTVVVNHPLAQDRTQVRLGIGIIQSRHSRRIVPITRSQIEFAFGLATGDRNTSTPRALIELSRCLAKIASRSWIRYLWLSASPMTSLSCCSAWLGRACGDVHVRQSARAVLDDDKHVQHPKRCRDGDEEVAGEDGRGLILRNVDQRRSPRGRPGGRFGKYLRTVRGEIRIPSLSSSSLAIRSSPHSTFSRAILRISARSSFGIGGRPARDFIRQNNRQPARCQRIIVAGCTTTSALRQSNSLEVCPTSARRARPKVHMPSV